jgi:hypothetical protein
LRPIEHASISKAGLQQYIYLLPPCKWEYHARSDGGETRLSIQPWAVKIVDFLFVSKYFLDGVLALN